jgi:signal transduction histidine kinase
MVVNQRTSEPSSFVGQGILILLPVVLLALAGLVSLRQDRLLVEAEARNRAEELIGPLAYLVTRELIQPSPGARKGTQETVAHHEIDAEKLLELPGLSPARQELAARLRRFPFLDPQAVRVFEIEANGQLSRPSPRSTAPIPQTVEWDDVERLASRLHQQIRPADSTFPETYSQLVESSRDHGRSKPQFTAAIYSLALRLEKEDQWLAAHHLYWYLQQEFPVAPSASGLPMGQLALTRLTPLAMRHIELTQRDPLRQSFSSGASGSTNNLIVLHGLMHRLSEVAVLYPSAISERLLDMAEAWEQQRFSGETPLASVRLWRQLWLADKAARSIYEDWRRDSPNDLAFSSGPRWIRSDTQRWLITRIDPQSVNEQVLLAQSEARVRDVLKRLDNENRSSGNVPPYFGVFFDVAGHRMTPGPARDQDILAQTVERDDTTENGQQAGRFAPLRAGIFLSNPALLYAHQRQRSRWFGLLILAAVGTSAAGFVSAYRAYKRQLQLSRMKSNFVSSVSHELRAPIASIRLMAEGLERGRVTDDTKRSEYFRFIVQECRRLGGLIERVLDFSRIEQGRKQYEFEPIDPSALVAQTLQVMEPYAAEKGVRLESKMGDLRSADFTGEIHWDGRAIQQALINLIDNAIKHSPSNKHVTVGLESGHEQHTGQKIICLWVRDQGEGIPPDEQKRIFEWFYRSGSELRRKIQGVGIGLSLVKHIVEAHRGRIRVESQVGHGTQMNLEIPTKPSDITQLGSI